MARLLSGLTAAIQNIESIYAYLRIMNSHHLVPAVIPVSQLRELLKYVQQEISGSPRLELPLDLSNHDIQGYYDVIRVTALLVEDVLFIVMCTVSFILFVGDSSEFSEDSPYLRRSHSSLMKKPVDRAGQYLRRPSQDPPSSKHSATQHSRGNRYCSQLN